MGNGMILMGLGFELIGLCFGGYFFGHAIDQYYGWNNYATGILVLLLLIGWFIQLFYMLRRFEKQDAERETKP